MKLLSIGGTIAMFLVGGGILVHNVSVLHHVIEGITQHIAAMGSVGDFLASVAQMGLDGLVGLGIGAVTLLVVMCVKRFAK